jgi:hypothetical protein
MNIRTAVFATLGAAALCWVAVAFAGSSPPPATQASVTIQDSPGNGLVEFAPLTLTMAQLEALPATPATLPDGTTESGPLLSSLLTKAGFKLITGCKNDQLHYWIEASSLDGSGAEISDGELDSGFGNNPAILSVKENGAALTAPRLVVTKDKTTSRDVGNVFNITVGRADQQLPQSASNAGCTPPGYTHNPPVAVPATGSVLINGPAASVPSPVVTWDQLSGTTPIGGKTLAQVDQTVGFLQGTTPQVRDEQGPLLYDVLSAADPELASVPSDDTSLYLQGTSSEDGASAIVSWAEIDPARNANPDLLSRGEAVIAPLPMKPFHLFIPPGGTDTGPRTTAPGDVKGGRWTFGVQIITVFRAPVVPAPTTGGPDLSGQNLKDTPLANAYLVGATMTGSNLNKGDLSGALLVNADLSGANLNGADLSGALLNGANLSGANLHGADLTGANLTGANLSGANLTGVVWSNTTCPDGSNSDSDGGSCSA